MGIIPQLKAYMHLLMITNRLIYIIICSMEYRLILSRFLPIFLVLQMLELAAGALIADGRNGQGERVSP